MQAHDRGVGGQRPTSAALLLGERPGTFVHRAECPRTGLHSANTWIPEYTHDH